MIRRPVGRPVLRHTGVARRRLRAAQTLLAAGALATFALGTLPAAADELRMEPTPERRLDTPPRGMTMDRVRATFGRPNQQRAAVGDPPITRWEYDGFVVYFEYQYVLHSVVKRGS